MQTPLLEAIARYGELRDAIDNEQSTRDDIETLLMGADWLIERLSREIMLRTREAYHDAA